MDNITIRVSDYTEYPGARYIEEGPNSGEHYRNTILRPKYEEALSKGIKLIIDVDGCEGKPSSFYNEALGGLVRQLVSEGNKKLTPHDLWKTITIVSEYPDQVERVKKYATDQYLRDNVLEDESNA